VTVSLGNSAVSPGEMDLAKMLASIKIERRAELVTVVSLPEPVALGDGVHAVLTEVEGTTVIATLDEAERRGWPANFVAVWLTVQVHSSLEAVGLTAAMSRALTERQIPCNVLAGFYHDHLLVPVDRADEAVATLESLAEPAN